MSRTTSPSALVGLPVGWLAAPSTGTAMTVGAGLMPSDVKYCCRSAVRKPPPSSMIPMVCPLPLTPVGHWYRFFSCGTVNEPAGPAAGRSRARDEPGLIRKCGLACRRVSRPNTPRTLGASQRGTCTGPVRPRITPRGVRNKRNSTPKAAAIRAVVPVSSTVRAGRLTRATRSPLLRANCRTFATSSAEAPNRRSSSGRDR